jgi:uncharacterized membrane protein
MTIGTLGSLWHARSSRGRSFATKLGLVGLGVGVGATGLAWYAARARGRAGARGKLRIAQAITVNRSAEQVYTFWRDLQNLPAVLSHLESVRSIGDRRYHCTARANGGSPLEWDAEISSDRPNERIEWRSLPSSRVKSVGSVRFELAPAARGTEIHVELEYEGWGGGAIAIGRELAKLLSADPGHRIREDLRRFKQVLETGEVMRSDATLERGPSPMQKAARPPELAPVLPTTPSAERGEGVERRP